MDRILLAVFTTHETNRIVSIFFPADTEQLALLEPAGYADLILL
jgi:hypothetical protein